MGRLSAGYELLGKLGNDLRDLTGFDTLIYELIQNADDARDATRMRFDVTKSALTVWNDGTFTDCGEQEARECPGVELDGVRGRCDLHSFRLISGHAKRGKAGTTGAFGIGFTSVFQVTDYPELMCGGRHWILRYDEPENENVEVCEGCDRDHHAPGTTFVLPWARDPMSRIRKGLRFEPVGRAVEQRFGKVAAQCLPDAMIFLRRVHAIELCREGTLTLSLVRRDIESWRYIEDGSADAIFCVLTGDFDDEAFVLRRRYSNVLGADVREAVVAIAIPTERGAERLPLHAVLPTLETTPLQFRLSSSFYPSQNRKRLKFEGDGDAESEWNRAAVHSAARLVATKVEALAPDLGHVRLWSVIRSCHELATQIDAAPDPDFALFWDELVEHLPESEVVWTADDAWVRPPQVALLEEKWEVAIEALRELGISVVHPEIRAAVAEVSAQIGLDLLGAEEVAAGIRRVVAEEIGLLEELPGVLGEAQHLNALLAVVADLASQSDSVDGRLEDFDGCAVVPCVGGVAAPPEKVVLANSEASALFRALPGINIADVERISGAAPDLMRLLAPLVAEDITIAMNEARDDGRFDEWSLSIDVREVLKWFARRANELDDWDIETLKSLPLFPASKGTRPIDDLQLPGSFERDPLGVAATVDLTGIEGLKGFLGADCLGAPTLSLDVYVRELLVPAFKAGERFEATALDKLLGILASSLEELGDADIALLSQMPIIPTSGGRTSAQHAYFDTEEVRNVLGRPVIVSIPQRQPRRMKSLFEALGVASEPRAADIITAVETVASKPKSKAAVARIRAIVEHLGPSFRFGPKAEEDAARERLEAEFGELFELEWLPIADGEWGAPGDVYRTDWRTAFESTGTFIELPEKTVQMPNADLLELLGVRLRPEVELVVLHLLNCVQRGEAVARRVYQALDDDPDSDELDVLKGVTCILVSRDPLRYAAPNEVVRDAGALRGYLDSLPSDLVPFSSLMEVLEIADAPEAKHAIEVLRRLARGYDHDRDYAALQACWRILDEALDEPAADDEIFPLNLVIGLELATVASWPDRLGELHCPGDLFIDDLPALRRHIPDEVQKLLVDHPRSGARALREAGLEFLSEAISEEIVAVPNPVRDDDLARLLRHREEALARLLAAEALDLDGLDELSHLEIFAVDEIVIHREIEQSGQDLGNHPISAYLDEGGRRLFIERLDVPAWTEIAVELVRLLCGPGHSRLAATVANVLQARTTSEAHDHLDVLQIPRLSAAVQAEFDSNMAETVLFGDEPVEAEPQEEWDTGEAEDTEEEAAGDDDERVERRVVESSSDTAQVGDSTTASPSGIHVATGSVRSAQEERGDSSSQAPGPVGSRLPNATDTGARAGAGAPVGSKAPAVDGKPTTPWRVWVSGRSGTAQDARAANPSNAGIRDKVSQRAVERTLQYESNQGRDPIEMPPNNPGFDVKSGPGKGRPPTRLIEVKGLAGTWEAEWNTAGNSPQLTAEQFRMSGEDGSHWLYVVENALDDEFWAVFPIQTVGKRANRYLLDHGWKEAADRPAGPGLDDDGADGITDPELPDLSLHVFGPDERDVGDIPFLSHADVRRVGHADFAGHDRWFTSLAAAEENDFAIQQLERSMGPTLPAGSIAVFRPTNGVLGDGEIVIADVAGEHEEPRIVIRRGYVVRDEDGEIEGLHLRVDVPGSGDEFEFHDPHATGRVLASLVTFQELKL
ncbi:MAG: DUF3883 domain-containing protein [Actinomycetota bacterium]|nr:DUF3883 domain-containing protein [Actinomycetota bacterium]